MRTRLLYSTLLLLLSIALVSLTATSFGQLSSYEQLSVEERLFFKRNKELTYYSADYKSEFIRIESWMTEPFESGFAEEALYLESWMTEPFKSGFAEEDLYLESWMTTPFESCIAEEELILESWMATTWI